MKKMLIAAGMIVLFSQTGWAYEGGPVTSGGEIKGRVKVAGEIPKDPTVEVTKDPQHCGKSVPREKYVISADGGVQWAAVFIEGITKGKVAPKEDLPIVNKMCQFHPHVQVGMTGQTVDVKNEDPMLHNTHMRFNNLTVFNSALPRQGMTIKRAINKTGLVDVQCDAHTFMHGFLYLADNPYITVTDAQGRFSIKDVPAGTYKLKFWHEAFGGQEKSVTITAGGAAEVNIEFGK